ncbi:pyridoxal-phosphate dependent enzyme [Streptomyces sp. NPDC059454]|uniref:pyridoxal-phosphate dependent enzyme n=1 Tax=Streptomyces sp. NPDC059454 TaxID=3346836 RepID=UPI0036949DAA
MPCCAYGAEPILTPAAEGMRRAVARAAEPAERHGWFMPRQFTGPANPDVHRRTTAREIRQDTAGQVDVPVAGVGTVTGVGRLLKEKKPEVGVVAVEPAESAVLSGDSPGPHRPRGPGAGFVPDVLDTSVHDEVCRVVLPRAQEAARRPVRYEGVLAGVPGGAALDAATALARYPRHRGALIVVVLPGTGERCPSTDPFARRCRRGPGSPPDGRGPGR